MTRTTTSTGKTELVSLGTAQGKPAKAKTRKVVVEGKPRGAIKAAEGANKRDGETISTSSESRAHVNRKARVETRANVVSPQGKEKTPTDKDESMEESVREAEAGMTVSLEDEAVNVKEKETTSSKKKTDGTDVDVAEVDNEEDYNMMTANEEIEVEDNTKANANILFLVLAKARHKIKTGYGKSDWVYGDKDIPILGCRQGNGLGPALWALISTKVIKMCERV
jgi:hypothetical protein